MMLGARPRDIPNFFHHIAMGTVASTNDEATRHAREGAAEGTVITAVSQTAGRGRRGRKWQSPEGNLFLSLILRPKNPLSAAAPVGFAGVVAIADTLNSFVGGDAGIAVKWPNDVLIHGKKVSGLMIEQAGGPDDALILGIGINIAWHPEDTPYPASDMTAEGASVTAEKVLPVFCDRFLNRYRQFQAAGFAPLRAAWLERAAGLGKPLTITVEGRRFDGVFKGIDEEGALLLDQGDDGIKTITAGDVQFAGAEGPAAC